MAVKKTQAARPQVAMAGVDYYAELPVDQRHDESKVVFAPVWCGGYDTDESGERLYHHFTGKRCDCPPGPQIIALTSDAREIALGGGRGSAKTHVGFGFILKGNDVPNPTDPVDISYINSPDYRFLVLRETSVDLDDWFDRAVAIYSHYGVKPNYTEKTLEFPSGAMGICGHMQDQNAYRKYQGKQYQRIILEEATQIAEEKLISRILLSLRSPKNKKLKPQVMFTANPDGPGITWFKARFINLNHRDGRPTKPGEKWTGAGPKLSRCFVKSTVYDNPYLLANDPAYVADLENLPPGERERWLEGDFDAIEGQFFTEFRPDGPKPSRKGGMEPPEANHVIPDDSVALADYWPRAISLDIGYNHRSAAYWGCWTPKRQLHVYRELSVAQMGFVELGYEIAMKSIGDLQRLPNQHMMLYCSHDAFNRDSDAPTEAEQIAIGISKAIGKDAAFVYDLTPEEEKMPTADAWASVQRRQRDIAHRTSIIVIRAPKNTKATAAVAREYFRFWQLAKATSKPNEELARRIILEQGALAWKQYMDSFVDAIAEILPKIQIWKSCVRLIACLKLMVRDPNDPDKILKQTGDDEWDSLGYLIGGFKYSEAEKPRGIYIADKVNDLRAKHPGMDTQALVMANRMAEAEYDRNHTAMSQGFNIPRGPRRPRVN
jgi:hypothetical protein